LLRFGATGTNRALTLCWEGLPGSAGRKASKSPEPLGSKAFFTQYLALVTFSRGSGGKNGDMKQTLPWNVTGIPPEARDAARAAASREGLSVGDWLTRRILSENERMGIAEPREPNEPSYRRSDEARRDQEDLIARLARSEAETESAFRRIDDTLKSLSRRLETTERSQNEAQRAMSTAAAEINAATREQAQAFSHLTQRLNTVERGNDNGAMRDAVRVLHQGLSRLADQIARTATESSGQIATIAGNMEALAGKLDATHVEFANQTHSLEQRLEQKIDEKLSMLADRVRSAEERSAAAEERSAAAERLQATVNALETRVQSAEEHMQEALGRHLSGIERTLEDISTRLEQSERREGQVSGSVQEALRELGDRIDSGDKHTREVISELRSDFGTLSKRFDAMDSGAAYAVAGAAPPFASPAGPAAAAVGTSPFDLPPFPDAPPFPSGSYAAPRPGDDYTPPAALETTDVFAAAVEAEPEPRPSTAAQDYLAAARRAAQAAAEEPVRKSRGTSARSALGADPLVPKERKRSPIMAVAIFVVLMIAAAGFFFSRSLFTSAPTPAAEAPAEDSAAPMPLPVAPPVETQSGPPAIDNLDGNYDALPGTDPLPDDGYNTQPDPSAIPGRAGAAGPQTAAPAGTPGAATPLDRLLSKAKAGDSRAQLVLGLKYLDGDGVAASDSEAVRWLRRAAEQGEAVAQYRLGALYERGRGVPSDPKQASYWYEQSAKRGNRKAMHNLAVAYSDGSGVAKNLPEAARWFRMAADLGLTDSQFNLAVLYERGMGVPASLNDAYRWYVIAAQQGDTESKARVDVLTTQLPAADKQTAERAARSFTPKPMDRAANDPPTLAEVAP